MFMVFPDGYLSVTVLSGSLSSVSSVECFICGPPLRGPGLRAGPGLHGPPRKPRGSGEWCLPAYLLNCNIVYEQVYGKHHCSPVCGRLFLGSSPGLMWELSWE